MPTIPLSDIVDALKPRVTGNPEGAVTSFDLDSRRCKPGSLFFAFRGERADGHDFVNQALENGAAAAVVEREVAGVSPLMVVEEVGQALLDAGSVARSHSRARFVAITGSVGKTTTKEMVAALLSVHGHTCKTEGNLNNLLGVPITLSRVPDHARFAVVEMGMNAPGEIDTLASITRPHAGIITNVGPVHLEGLGSVDGVRRAKAELIPHVTGPVVLPADDPALLEMARSQGREVITFGWDQGDVRVKGVRVSGSQLSVTIELFDNDLDFSIPVPVPAYATNAAAALGVLVALGIEDPDPDPLERLSLPSGRMEIHRLGGVTVVFDAYNANNVSFRAAMGAARSMAGARVLGIFGDMLELGDASPELHRSLGSDAHGFEYIAYVGQEYRFFRNGLPGDVESAHAPTPEDAARMILERVRDGDVVLIKASHGIHLERAFDTLRKGLEE